MFPRLRAMASLLADYGGAEELDQGITILLGGLAVQLHPTTSSTPDTSRSDPAAPGARMTTTAADHTGRHQHSTTPHEQAAPALVAPALAAPLAPAPTRTPASRLDPEEDFPEDLTGLGMVDLQVLHSRITRQLDHNYLTDPAGPHPVTMDWGFEVAAELAARDTA